MHAAGHEVTSDRLLPEDPEDRRGAERWGGQAVLVLQRTVGHLCVCVHGWGFLVFIFI